jgi:hypothetical protein
MQQFLETFDMSKIDKLILSELLNNAGQSTQPQVAPPANQFGGTATTQTV